MYRPDPIELRQLPVHSLRRRGRGARGLGRRVAARRATAPRVSGPRTPRVAGPSGPRRRRVRPLLAATLVLTLLPAAALAQRAVDRTVAAAADGTVEIHNVAGSVTVRGWDRAEVAVTGTLEREVEELRVESRGETTVIEVVLPKRARGNVDAELEVRMPRAGAVTVDAVSADLDVDEVDGAVKAVSVSGTVVVAGRPASVVASTVSGRVEVDAETSDLRLEAVSGDVEARGARGEVRAQTVSGDVRLELGAVSRLAAQAVSGDVFAACDLDAGARVELSSHNGDLELRLPRASSAHVVVTTFSGEIDNALGPAARRAGKYTPEKILDFTLGGGDAQVELTTFSGDVELKAR